MTLKNVCKNVLPIMFAEDNSLLLLVGADHRVASHRPKCGSSAPSSQLAKARGLARSSYERETPGHEQTLTHFHLHFSTGLGDCRHCALLAETRTSASAGMLEVRVTGTCPLGDPGWPRKKHWKPQRYTHHSLGSWQKPLLWWAPFWYAAWRDGALTALGVTWA